MTDKNKIPEPELDAHGEDHEAQLQEEVKNYLQEKERVRRVLGRVGGTPGKREKVINVVFLTVVAITFAIGIVFPKYHAITLEIAILLVSLKLALLLTQNAKMNHFQFWMLSTIEWRLGELTKDFKKAQKDLEKVKEVNGKE